MSCPRKLYSGVIAPVRFNRLYAFIFKYFFNFFQVNMKPVCIYIDP